MSSLPDDSGPFVESSSAKRKPVKKDGAVKASAAKNIVKKSSASNKPEVPRPHPADQQKPFSKARAVLSKLVYASDCSGFDVGAMALKRLLKGKNITLSHAWASEIDPVARSVLKATHPECKHIAEDVTKHSSPKLRGLIKKNDLLCYTSGFPCVPYSKQGKREGVANPKSGMIIYDVLNMIQDLLPALCILENVKELATDPKYHETFQEIIEIAQKLGGGCYYVDWKILDSWEYGGVPAARLRVYIVLVKKQALRKPWQWPQGVTPLCLNEVLEENLPPVDVRTLPVTNLRNLAAGLGKLKKDGADTKRLPCVIDLAAGEVFGTNVQINKFPTITKSHANALWLVHKSRFASPREILRGQGIDLDRDLVCPSNVKPKKLAEMAGNSFTLPVFQRLFAALLPAMGYKLE